MKKWELLEKKLVYFSMLSEVSMDAQKSISPWEEWQLVQLQLYMQPFILGIDWEQMRSKVNICSCFELLNKH